MIEFHYILGIPIYRITRNHCNGPQIKYFLTKIPRSSDVCLRTLLLTPNFYFKKSICSAIMSPPLSLRNLMVALPKYKYIFLFPLKIQVYHFLPISVTETSRKWYACIFRAKKNMYLYWGKILPTLQKDTSTLLLGSSSFTVVSPYSSSFYPTPSISTNSDS